MSGRPTRSPSYPRIDDRLRHDDLRDHVNAIPRTTHVRRLRLIGGAAAAAVILVGLPATASGDNPPGGQGLQEMQRQRDQVRAQKAAQAGKVDALKATDAQVTSALDALNADVNAQQGRVEEAERAVTAAEADRSAAEQAQAQAQAQLDQIKVQLRESAVQAFVTLGSSEPIASVGADNVNEAVNKRTLLSVKANQNIDLVERFRSTQEDLALQRATAADAAERAAKNRSAVKDRMNELNSAYDKQQAFAAQVDQRVESALAEADSLAAIDTKLSTSITAKETEIARALAAQQAAEQARAAQRAAQNRTAFRPSSGGGGTSPPGGVDIPPPVINGAGSIVTVGGIQVSSSIAGQLQALLSAAAAAGINFGGGGYRDPAGQIAVRRSNCGSSNYAIYQAPASSCHPPTARPGQSMHERGLAIDFTQGGSTLSRGSSGFSWLNANASRFGFYNLPSEPWHWSTTGQ
jgi:peptidoglycan hydrolase CwlO-like protein